MSPLNDIQRRYRELGRIRLGEKGAKGQPVKRKTFRLTTSNRDLLDAAQLTTGGEVREWKGAPTEGTQYELDSEADRIECRVPPGEVLSQWWEMWTGGGCLRRCDGTTETLSGDRCMCPADIDDRLAAAQNGNACRATTRLSVILPFIPDLGVWRVETHGLNAAAEIPGMIEFLNMASQSGIEIPAQLRIEQRTSKKDGKTQHFVVPVVEFPTLTFNQLETGEKPLALGNGATKELAPPAAGELATPPEIVDTPAPAKRTASRSARPAEPDLPGDSPVKAPPPDPGLFADSVRSHAKRFGVDDETLVALIAGETTSRTTVPEELTGAEATAVIAAIKETAKEAAK